LPILTHLIVVWHWHAWNFEP